MRINKINLNCFRNYKNLCLEFTHNLNIFVGENAQGKTNILEAIYLSAMGISHRTNDDQDFINWQYQGSTIELSFSRQETENKILLKFIRNQKKEILLNGFKSKPGELVGNLNVVLFSPEDLWMIKGAPAIRRRFLDMEISQANPSYYRQLQNYRRIVNQRNNLLKQVREKKSSPLMLQPWDEQFALSAAVIAVKRIEAVKKLNMLANLMHRKITGNRENLFLTYAITGVDGDIPANLNQWYMDALAKTRDFDIARGSTGTGPHRDDLAVYVNGRNLRVFGSQGQQRTGVLALKLSELEFLKSETGQYPVLLLDDVMSELDPGRRGHLMAFIKDRIQTFITATDKKYFDEGLGGRFYRVVDGKVLLE